MTERCQHKRLMFGSGGHYIFCDKCSACWSPDGDKKSHSLRCETGVEGYRVTQSPLEDLASAAE